MLPGTGPGVLETSQDRRTRDPVIEGEVAPDPSKALAAATKAFEKAGDTLKAINEAAQPASPRSPRAPRISTVPDVRG